MNLQRKPSNNAEIKVIQSLWAYFFFYWLTLYDSGEDKDSAQPKFR